MEIPKIPDIKEMTDLMVRMSHEHMRKKMDEAQEIEHSLRKLEIDSQKALVKMAEKSWTERNIVWFTIIMTLLGAICGAIAQRLIEVL